MKNESDKFLDLLSIMFLLDLTNLMVTTEQQISRSKANKDAWIRINPRSSVLLDEHSLSFSSINRALQYISEYVVVNNQEVV